MDAAGWVWGSSPSPQAAPASPSRPLRSSGRHDGTRIGGAASATRSTFSLDTCRAPAATALSPPRGVGPVGAGPAPARKAAPPAGLGPACRCGGAAAPRPLRARYRLRASGGRSSQTRRRSAGTASSPRAAPPSVRGGGLRGPTLSVLQEVRGSASAAEGINFQSPHPRTAATPAIPILPHPCPLTPHPHNGSAFHHCSDPHHCSEPQGPITVGTPSPQEARPFPVQSATSLQKPPPPPSLQVSSASVITSVTTHSKQGIPITEGVLPPPTANLPTTAVPSPHFFWGWGG